jgi:hypothetical protein
MNRNRPKKEKKMPVDLIRDKPNLLTSIRRDEKSRIFS